MYPCMWSETKYNYRCPSYRSSAAYPWHSHENHWKVNHFTPQILQFVNYFPKILPLKFFKKTFTVKKNLM